MLIKFGIYDGFFVLSIVHPFIEIQESKKIDDDEDDEDTDADAEDVSSFVLEKQPQYPYLLHYIAEYT